MSFTCEFNTKHSDGNRWLVVEHPEGEYPSELAEDLAIEGWVNEALARGFRSAPAHNGVAQTIFISPGTGAFGRWTPREHSSKMVAARKLLMHHGVAAPIPERVLTLAEMI